MTEREPSIDDAELARRAGRAIVDRIRADANAGDAYFAPGDDDEDVFRSLYLTPRETAIPEHLLSDDLLHDIHADLWALYGQVFNGIRAELNENFGPSPIWVVVDPDVEDRTVSVLCTHESLLLMHSSKAWQFFWTTEDEMAADVGRWYERAAARLRRERADNPNHGIREGV